ncbi:MerR family transcriptional regulator [Streptomyces odontomachi]|uniref:MerR family transcriptional regulator n=1 Tax=Streptomyces odontomachi TaxID=2944940 RepID=UPI00210E0FFC|nr:MerR family transcriptional regulator [Streptomyces sp. ODS25]
MGLGTGPGGHPDNTGLLTIGAFAARARLSPKALRLYARTGLLAPVHVDELSGYRYYHADQVERARTVALLRRLDMPLAGIAEVLRTPGEPAARQLVTFWREVEERVAAQRTLVDYLRARLSGRSSPLYGSFEVRTVDVPAQYVIAQSRHTLAHELPAWIVGSLDRLVTGAAACGGVAGAPFVVYHSEVTEESDGPAESCVPVRDAAAARAWALQQGRTWATQAREEPAHRLAYTRIVKAQVAYPQIIAAFEAVEEWIAGQRLKIAGPCREIYFYQGDWAAAAPDDEVCDVAFPISD